MSKRRVDGPEEDSRPSKRTKVTESLQLPAKYAIESNSLLLDFTPGEGDSIDGGCIKGKVANVLKYKSTGRAGLILRLPEVMSNLECVIPLNDKTESELPVALDIVHIALTDPEFVLINKTGQLPFKLEFMNVNMLIQSGKEQGSVRKLQYNGKRTALQDASTKSTFNASERPGPQVQAKPVDISVPGVAEVAENEAQEPNLDAAKQKRVRKRGTRHVNQPSKQQNVEVPENLPSTYSAAIQPADSTMQEDSPERPELPQIVKVEEEDYPSNEFASVQPDEGSARIPPSPPQRHVWDFGQMDGLPTGPGVATFRDEFGSGFICVRGTFYSLAELATKSFGHNVNFVGIVKELGEPKKAGRDYIRMMTLKDPSRPDGGFKVNLFSQKAEWLPDVVTGQILLLFDIKVESFNNEKRGTGFNNKWKWIAYDPDERRVFFNEQSTPNNTSLYQIGDEERTYFDRLADWIQTAKTTAPVVVPTTGSIATSDKKHRLLKDLNQEKLFINATIEVLHVDHSDRRLLIFVTDYTRNELFGEYPNAPCDPVRWLPKHTMKIRIRPKNEVYENARAVQTGKYYRVKNLRLSSYEDGDADMLFDASFNLLKSTSQDSDLLRLLERKRSFVPDGEGLRMASTPIINDIPRGNPKSTRTVIQTVETNDDTLPDLIDNLAKEPLTNEKIVPHRQSPFISFKDIARLDGPGYRFNLRARIVDIIPTNPLDLVALICKKCESRFYDAQRCFECGTAEQCRIDIMFSFLIVDENGDFLPVIVQGDNAVQLFKLDSTYNALGNTDVDPVIKAVIRKLRNVVGDLWSQPPVEERLNHRKDEAFDINVLIETVDSPWIDLTVTNWQKYDKVDSRWISKFSVTDTTFEPSQVGH